MNNKLMNKEKSYVPKTTNMLIACEGVRIWR